MKATSFEDLKIWQSARELSKEIYTVTRLPEFSKDYRFVGQITAAMGSVMDNIAEGFERDGNKVDEEGCYGAIHSTDHLTLVTKEFDKGLGNTQTHTDDDACQKELAAYADTKINQGVEKVLHKKTSFAKN